MHIPNAQQLMAGGLAFAATANDFIQTGNTVTSGKILDYAVEKCLDADKNIRCSKPFPVKADGCYRIEWSTEGAISHTTVEVRDAGSSEIVYYRDTDGEWKPEKNELVYMDFRPKIPGQGNNTVEYKVKKCNEDNGAEM